MRSNSANLDFIRTVAVLSVVLRHVLGEFDIAYVGPFRAQLLGIFGVMLFFVHTAHVLMFSLERLQAEQAKGLYWRFMVRRAFRIYPLSVVVVLIGVFATAWRDVPGFAPLSVKDAIANLLLVQNITGSKNIIGTLWSLPLEVQMYLVLPAVFLLVRRNFLAVGAVYVVAVLLGLMAFRYPLPEVFRFLPCFMPGVVAYALVSRGVRRRLPFWALNLVLLFAWCAYSVLGNRSQTAGAYLSCLVVGLCIPFALDSQRQILNTISETVAKYSYGIYLVHAPVLALSFALPLPAAVKLAIFAAASGALSYLAYRFIEDPLVQFGKTVTEPVAAARVAI